MTNSITTQRAAAGFFWAGAAALIAQAVLLRELMVSIGGSELVISLFFVSWFAGIGLGAWLGGRKAEAWRDRSTFIFTFGAVLPAATLLAMQTLPLWWPTPTGEVAGWGQTSAAAAFCFPLGFWLGVVFPVVSAATRDGDAVGRLFTSEAVGAAVGGVTFSLLLATRTTPLAGAMLAGALVVLGTAALAPRTRRFRVVGAIAMVVVFLSPLGGWTAFTIETARFEARHPGAKLTASLQTPYQSVSMAQFGEQTAVFAGGAFRESFPDPATKRLEAALILGQAESATEVLLLGGGVTGLAQELLAAPGVGRVTLVVLDEKLSRHVFEELPAEWQAVLELPRFRVVFDDERRFLRESTDEFDLIVVDAPDPTTALTARLFSAEFYAAARGRLSAVGVLVTSVAGAENYVGEEIGGYVGSIVKSLREAFQHVAAWPGDRTWLTASQATAGLAQTPEEMMARYSRHFGGKPLLPAEAIVTQMDGGRREAFEEGLDRHGAAPNRDLYPVSFLAFLRVWDRFAGGGLGAVLRAMSRVSPRGWGAFWMAAALLAFCLPLFGNRRRAASRYALVSLATSGFGAMGLVIVVSVAYQSLAGQMYQMVAFLFGHYMLGLAAGGRLARTVGRSVDVVAAMVLADAAFVAVTLGLALALPRASGWSVTTTQVLLPVALGLAGVAAGLAFPLAARVLGEAGMSLGGRAGWVDAVDHLAALAGAALVGLWFLPTAGVVAALWVIFLLKSTAALAGLVVRGRAR
jgi:spermidine synthase